MKFITEIRVRYVETDAMGIVHHGNYFNWMEVGRTEFFRYLGLPYAEIEAKGIYFPVIEVHCKYIKPAKYDEQVLVETEIEKYTAARVVFNYTILRKTDRQVLVQGQTIHAFVNEKGRQINIKKVPFMLSKLEEATNFES